MTILGVGQLGQYKSHHMHSFTVFEQNTLSLHDGQGVKFEGQAHVAQKPQKYNFQRFVEGDILTSSLMQDREQSSGQINLMLMYESFNSLSFLKTLQKSS